MNKRGPKFGHRVTVETREKISAALHGRSYVDLGRRRVGEQEIQTQAERTRKWAKKHPEYQASWRAKNPTKSAFYSKKYRDADPLRAKSARRKAHLKATYSLTEPQAHRLLSLQEGRCAICKTPIAFHTGRTGAHIDHDHHTKRNRGILCSGCNLGLGKFKDNAELLVSAAEYLKFHDG